METFTLQRCIADKGCTTQQSAAVNFCTEQQPTANFCTDALHCRTLASDFTCKVYFYCRALPLLQGSVYITTVATADFSFVQTCWRPVFTLQLLQNLQEKCRLLKATLNVNCHSSICLISLLLIWITPELVEIDDSNLWLTGIKILGKAVNENGKGLQEASMVAFKYTPLPITYSISSMGIQSMSENRICQPMTGCDQYEVKEKTALGGMRQRWASREEGRF